jgi:hypothetical protein
MLQTVIQKEQKRNAVITVKVTAGLIESVEIPETLRAAVVVVDYDVEGSEERLDTDRDGDNCRISVWKNGK